MLLVTNLRHQVYRVLAEVLDDPARLQGLPTAGFVGEAGFALQLPRVLNSGGAPATVELIIADDASGVKAARLLSVRLDLVCSLMHVVILYRGQLVVLLTCYILCRNPTKTASVTVCRWSATLWQLTN